jgi:acetyltransferase-like isoleucine patch superfamily enzyme
VSPSTPLITDGSAEHAISAVISVPLPSATPMNVLRRILNRPASSSARSQSPPGAGAGAQGVPRKPGSLSLESAVAAGVLTLGERSYGALSVILFPGDTAKARIGRYCSLAEGAELLVGGNHRTDWVTTYPLRVMFDLPGALNDGHPATKGDIVVGNDVWIGADSRILSGVTVGDGAVIGAGAVVATDVRPYAIVVGNPAQEVRRRFSDPVVESLLRIAWWDWPEQLISKRVEDLCNPDVESFVRRFDPGQPERL